jgi:hypothetical protein
MNVEEEIGKINATNVEKKVISKKSALPRNPLVSLIPANIEFQGKQSVIWIAKDRGVVALPTENLGHDPHTTGIGPHQGENEDVMIQEMKESTEMTTEERMTIEAEATIVEVLQIGIHTNLAQVIGEEQMTDMEGEIDHHLDIMEEEEIHQEDLQDLKKEVLKEMLPEVIQEDHHLTEVHTNKIQGKEEEITGTSMKLYNSKVQKRR